MHTINYLISTVSNAAGNLVCIFDQNKEHRTEKSILHNLDQYDEPYAFKLSK